MHQSKERAAELEAARNLIPIRKVTPWHIRVCANCEAHVRFEPMWKVVRQLIPTLVSKTYHYCFGCCKDEGEVREAERKVTQDFQEKGIVP